MMDGTYWRALPVVAAAVLALGSPAWAQEPPQFRSVVELVQLQVGVADARGFFVSGLTADDFRVRVNGQPRPAQIVYEVDLRRGRDPSAAMAAADRDPRARPVAARRHFLLFFDFSFTNKRGVLEARRTAAKFVDQQVHPSDLLGVATANRYGIYLLTPFTSDHDQALASVNTLGLAKASDEVTEGLDAQESIEQALTEMGDAGGLEAMSAMNFREYVANVSNFTLQLQEFGRMLQAIEGRKHVVMFSSGFRDSVLTGQGLDALSAGAEARASSPGAVASSDPEMMYGAAEVRDGVAEAIEMFRSADAVIHAVDPSGLRAGSAGRQSMVAFADGTGGTVSWSMNDVSVALAQIEDATSTFYMIGYRKAAADPPTVEVQVEVLRTGVRVVSAPTRLTPPPDYRQMNAMQRQLQVAEFFNDDVERRDIDFDSQIVPFHGEAGASRAVVVIEVPGLELERLAAERGDELVQLEIGAFALDEQARVRDSFRRGVRVDLTAIRARGRAAAQQFLFSDFLHTASGAGSVKLLLREQQVGHLSSRTQRFWAPAADNAMRMMRPLVLSPSAAPVPPTTTSEFDPLRVAGKRFRPRARPTLAHGETIDVLVVVYHVPRHPVTGEIQAGVVLEIEDAEGSSYRVPDFIVVGNERHEEIGATQIVLRAVVPDDVPDGNLRLWARVADAVSGGRVEEQTSIVVRSR